jgi:diguanylate cyclase (GGDEF)-like protein
MQALKNFSLEKLFIGHELSEGAKKHLLNEFFKNARVTAAPAIITAILLAVYESSHEVSWKTWCWFITITTLQLLRYYFSLKAYTEQSKYFQKLFFSTDTVATLCWLSYPLIFGWNIEEHNENLLRGFLIYTIFVFYSFALRLHLNSLVFISFTVNTVILLYALSYKTIPDQFIWPISLFIIFGFISILYFGRYGFIHACENYELLSENQELIKKMDHMIIQDELTQLPNRRFFNTEIEKLLESFKIKKEAFSFAMIDIDKFKTINDIHGHDAGDIVLYNFGQFILSEIRENDILIRYGGEEFILILPNTSLKDAVVILERIRKNCVDNKIFIDDLPLNLSISIGVTDAGPGDTKITLLKRADLALYQAKNNGRNQLNTLPPTH